LLLLRTTALVSELSEAAVTCKQVDVSRIVNFAVRSPELLGWAGRAAINEIARPEYHTSLACVRISVSDENSDTMRASLKVEASNLHRKDNRCAMLQALAARPGPVFFFRAPRRGVKKEITDDDGQSTINPGESEIYVVQSHACAAAVQSDAWQTYGCRWSEHSPFIGR
jgi:hypothetical protein